MGITLSIPGPSPFTATAEVSTDHPRDQLAADVDAALATGGARTAPRQVWIAAVHDGDDARMAEIGFVAYRDLLQLRCPLPAARSSLETRAFVPDADMDAFIGVNNRAFAWHPEQSGMTSERVRASMAEPWFDADGFRILEVDGEIAGFCWTRIHPADPQRGEPALGEIYAIAIDPAHHGKGLGAPMTLAGLDWLSDAGLGVGMLYVEADNAPALATYARIGFVTHQVNRAYRDAGEPDDVGTPGEETTT